MSSTSNIDSFNNERPIVIIPARKNSKRIEGKNSRHFLGIPIICKTILLLRDMDIFDEIFVSTDCQNTRVIAEKCGASAPFLRPTELAMDDTPTLPVIKHALRELSIDSQKIAFCIYPTSIFLKKDLILESLKILASNSESIVFPAKKFPAPIERRFEINEKTWRLEHIDNKTTSLPTQKFKKYWYDISEFYCAQVSTWIRSNNLYESATVVNAKNHFSVDINDLDDWDAAAKLYLYLNGQNIPNNK